LPQYFSVVTTQILFFSNLTMMSLQSFLLGLLPLLLDAASASPVPADIGQRQTACTTVHVFIARGSTEPYPGRQGALADAICQGLPSCGYTDIPYPATFENYCASVGAGVSSGTTLVTSYASQCPSSNIVLTGYSQV
jgi:acetylxylan esterase